jgi:hypothetical protein
VQAPSALQEGGKACVAGLKRKTEFKQMVAIKARAEVVNRRGNFALNEEAKIVI